MSVLQVDEFLILIVIAAILFLIKRFFADATFTSRGEQDQDVPPRPPDCVQEAFKEIYNPERSANLGNIFHRDDNS